MGASWTDPSRVGASGQSPWEPTSPHGRWRASPTISMTPGVLTTLRNLRRVAEAMGCELVYAIVPKSRSIQELAESPARAEATKRVLSVRRTMALEDQGSGDVNELIDKETKRILKKP